MELSVGVTFSTVEEVRIALDATCYKHLHRTTLKTRRRPTLLLYAHPRKEMKDRNVTFTLRSTGERTSSRRQVYTTQ